MEKDEKVICRFDNRYFDTLYFSYLSGEDKADIRHRLEYGLSTICAFEKNDTVIFCAILDFLPENETLHVREIAGTFTREMTVVDGYKILDEVCKGLAKFGNFKYITFHGEKPLHERLSDNFGFQPIGQNDYRKVVH